MIDTIYLDMDGVCCDFLSAAIRLHDHDPVEVFERWPAGMWDVCHVLGMSSAQFWAPITGHAAFWSQLDAYPWFASLYAELRSLVPDVVFLTTPHNCPLSYAGKHTWLQRRGIPQTHIEMSARKARFARPGAVLIDDHDGNVAAFTQAGGYALTFPQLWNSHHEYADGSRCRRIVQQVKDLLQR